MRPVPAHLPPQSHQQQPYHDRGTITGADLFVPRLYHGVSLAVLYCKGGGKRENGKIIRKKTEPITIQHSTYIMMMMMMTMIGMMTMMTTIINTYMSVDAFCIDYPACGCGCGCCYRIN